MNQMIDISLIRDFLASGVTMYSVSQETKISRAQLGKYKKSPELLMKMSLENALKLQKLALEQMVKTEG